jgi:hypothetical protein
MKDLKMKKVIGYIFFILISCSLSFADDKDFNRVENLWQKQSQERNSDRSKYLIELLAQQNDMHLDEQGGCYEKPGSGITQIVTIDKNGVITSVVSNVENQKSECFRSLYLGKKFPQPPFAPIYDKMEMGYRKSN